MMMLLVVVVLARRKGRRCENRKQNKGYDELFHGMTLAPSATNETRDERSEPLLTIKTIDDCTRALL